MKLPFARRKSGFHCLSRCLFKHRIYLALAFILFLCLSDGFILTSDAVYEGTANANMMIRRYERKNQFAKAALWHEAAAECLDTISIPLAEIVIEYFQKIGNKEDVSEMKAEIVDTEKRRDEHLKRAKMDWEKTENNEQKVDEERAKIRKFIAEWVPHYPDNFYQFGIYRNTFKKKIDKLKANGKITDALLLEAEASDMCARQYNDVTIGYFQKRIRAGDKEIQPQLAAYQKVRDRHLGRSAMLRSLAKQNPESWPAAADEKNFLVPKSKRILTAEKAIQIAREDERTQEAIEGHRDIREFVWFQGFCWTVSYYSHDWKDLAIIFVDDKTGVITDILLSPGNLEEHEGDEEEREIILKRSPKAVIEIAREHNQVKSYFREYPDAKMSAAYNQRYNCWIIEVILDDKEVGVVTVSDKTGEVLEVALEQEDR